METKRTITYKQGDIEYFDLGVGFGCWCKSREHTNKLHAGDVRVIGKKLMYVNNIETFLFSPDICTWVAVDNTHDFQDIRNWVNNLS